MNGSMTMDWFSLFRLDIPLGEAVVRGTAVYFVLFVVLRVLLRRNVGKLSMMDLLMMVVVGNAVTNSLAGDSKSITSGLVVATTVIVWNLILEWLSVRFPIIERLTQPPPVVLVQRGAIQWRNMRSERISEQELMSQLREHGIHELGEVEKAQIEGDGRISVVRQSR